MWGARENVVTRCDGSHGERRRCWPRDAPAASAICVALLLVTGVGAQVPAMPPDVLPAAAVAALQASLERSRAHARHVWRDTPAFAGDEVQAYVEIAAGDARKWEFDIGVNARAIDRVMPADVGPYPVNYGFVPQTIAWDGDPFDALILGAPIPGGTTVRGVIVGLMLMEDEKGIDSKVVLAPVRSDGGPREVLTQERRDRIADYFRRYKRHEPGKFSRVPGWGTAGQGRAHVSMTHRFFRACRTPGSQPCRIPLADTR